jgi:cation transport ATPase
MNIEAALERKAADGHITDDHNDRDDDHDQGREHSVTAGEYVRLGLMALVIVASLTGWWRHWMLRDWLAFTATLVGGFPIFKEAWENLRKRRMTMELSMTIALIAALCIGQFLTALVIAFFVLFAEMVEGYTVGSGRRAIQTLIDALPRQVRVRRGGEERELGSCRRRDHHHSARRTHSGRWRGDQGP